MEVKETSQVEVKNTKDEVKKKDKKVKNLKYEKAWDNVTKRFVAPHEVNRANAHDRNRYFSEKFEANEDKGVVLTLHKPSKTFTNKNGTEIKRRAYFASIGANTRKYREQTRELITKQESSVHKICKEIAEEIKYIKVPEVKACLMEIDYTILHNQVAEVKFNRTERMDPDTRKIPDAVLEIELFGVKQEIYLEFLYSHEVTESKRKALEYHHKNCLEVDISHLRDTLELSDKVLKEKIKYAIENNCYWVSNGVQQYCEREAFDDYIITISKSGILRDSFYYKREDCKDEADWNYRRLFFFKDNLKVSKEHPCYFEENPQLKYTNTEKCTNIGECKACENCICITDYEKSDTSSTTIYCNKSGNKQKVNPFELVQLIVAKAIEFMVQDNQN